MSRNAATWRALERLARDQDPEAERIVDRILALAEGVQAAADAGDLDAAAALLDEFTGTRLLAEALPSWGWPGEGEGKE